MALAPNPLSGERYPTDPSWGNVGSNLITALFGNPAAAAKQQYTRAEIDKAQAEADLARENTRGARGKNDALDQETPGLFNIFTHPDSSIPTAVDPQSMTPQAYISGRPVVSPGLPSQATPAPHPLLSAMGIGQAPQADDGFRASDGSAPISVAAPRPHGATNGTNATVEGAPMQAVPVGQQLDLAKALALMSVLHRAGQGGEAPKSLGMLLALSGNQDLARAAMIGNGQNPAKDFAATQAQADNLRGEEATSELAKAVTTTILGQQGDNARNAATNATSRADNAASNSTSASNNAATIRGENWRHTTPGAGVAKAPGEKPLPRFAPAQLANMDGEISAQMPNLSPDLKTAVRVRAIELTQQSGNPAEGVQQALKELVQTNEEKGRFWGSTTTHTLKPQAVVPPDIQKILDRNKR